VLLPHSNRLVTDPSNEKKRRAQLAGHGGEESQQAERTEGTHTNAPKEP